MDTGSREILESVLTGLKSLADTLILNNKSSSDFEKLELITEYNIWEVAPYIPDIFDGYKKYPEGIYDDYFQIKQNYGRNEVVSFLSEIKYTNNDEEVLILNCRDEDDKVYISGLEFKNLILNHALISKTIGFRYDW